MEYIVKITESEAKAIEAHVGSVQDWLQQLLDSKAAGSVNRIINSVTDMQAHKLTKERKEGILKNVTVEEYSIERQQKDIHERLTYTSIKPKQ